MWSGRETRATTTHSSCLPQPGMRAPGLEGPNNGPTVKDDALRFALVKHPSDPGDPAGKLVLGVRSAARTCKRGAPKRAAGDTRARELDARRGPSTASPVLGEFVAGGFPVIQRDREESEARAFVPRTFRASVCVPAQLAKCFCTVDILDE